MRQNITTYIFCGFFIAIACLIQCEAYLNVDAAWLTDSALKLLNGQNLYTDYVETNPPFIVYLMVVPVWLGGMLGLKPWITFKIFILLMLLLAFLRSLKYSGSDYLKIIIAFGLFALPVQSFGQREHLFIAFVLPYFLCILNERRPQALDVVMLIFAMLCKPYFVIFFAGFVLWQWVVQKRSLFLIENFIVAFSLAAYVLWIWLFENDYFTNVLPLLNKYYSQFYFKRTSYYVKVLMFVMLAISLKIISPLGRNDDSPIFDKKASFMVFGAFLSTLMLVLQDKGWTNHYLPLYFFLILSIAMLMERSPKLITGALSLLMLGVFIHITYVSALEICQSYNNEGRKRLISFMDKYAAGKDVIEAGIGLDVLYPETLYSKASFNWEYPALWMLPGMYKKEDVKDGKIIFHKPGKRSPDEEDLIRKYARYVVDKKPAMIIHEDKLYSRADMGKFRFKLIEYFSQDAEFAQAFKKYKFVGLVDKRRIYVLDQQVPEANIPAKR